MSGIDVGPQCRGGYVAIGNFDGVHRGHQSMIALLAERARAAGVPAVVMTFDPHPWELLRPETCPPQLTTIDRRRELLRQYGADHVVVWPTDKAFLELGAADFFESVVRKTFEARGLVEGPNFFFGRNREGNVTVLKRLCEEHRLELDIVPPLTVDDQLVSSSVVRTLIQGGEMTQAVKLLGHPHRITGQVVDGVRRGRLLGFPTANLDRLAMLAPGVGVYAGHCLIDGTSYRTAVHIGPNPTFGEHAVKIEAHVLGFSGDLYGQSLDVDLTHDLRKVRPFPGPDALREQLQQDLRDTERLVALPGRDLQTPIQPL